METPDDKDTTALTSRTADHNTVCETVVNDLKTAKQTSVETDLSDLPPLEDIKRDVASQHQRSKFRSYRLGDIAADVLGKPRLDLLHWTEIRAIWDQVRSTDAVGAAASVQSETKLHHFEIPGHSKPSVGILVDSPSVNDTNSYGESNKIALKTVEAHPILMPKLLPLINRRCVFDGPIENEFVLDKSPVTENKVQSAIAERLAVHSFDEWIKKHQDAAYETLKHEPCDQEADTSGDQQHVCASETVD